MKMMRLLIHIMNITEVMNSDEPILISSKRKGCSKNGVSIKIDKTCPAAMKVTKKFFMKPLKF